MEIYLRLLKLQKRVARIILKTYIMTPLQCMFNEFRKRVQYHACIMVYKAMDGLAPE